MFVCWFFFLSRCNKPYTISGTNEARKATQNSESDVRREWSDTSDTLSGKRINAVARWKLEWEEKRALEKVEARIGGCFVEEQRTWVVSPTTALINPLGFSATHYCGGVTLILKVVVRLSFARPSLLFRTFLTSSSLLYLSPGSLNIPFV